MNTSNRSETTYAVLGVGAVGGLYGGLLAKAGYRVHFLARSDAVALKTTGLQVDSIWGDFSVNNLNVYSSAAQMPKVDCVLVTWKTTSNHELASILPSVCHDETIVVVVQNGLDVERPTADVVGSHRVLGGVVFLCCSKVGPGHVNHVDYGKIVLGRYDAATDPTTPRICSIVEELRNAGIEIDYSNDLKLVRWKKLAWNIPFNGLSVVLNADTSNIMQQKDSRDLAEQLMWEVLRCARACRVDIPDSHVWDNLEYTKNMVPYASSMLLDYQNRRPLELDAIFAAPIQTAKKAGYEPARVEMLHQQLRFLDWKNRFTESL